MNRIRLTLLFLVLSACSLVARAGDPVFTWEGDVSEKYTVDGNWQGGSAPAFQGENQFFSSATGFNVDLENAERAVSSLNIQSTTPYVFSNGTFMVRNNIIGTGSGVTHTLNSDISAPFDNTTIAINVGEGCRLLVNGLVSTGVLYSKFNTGILELTADNPFTNTMTVNGGTLLANNPVGSATGPNTVTVNSGGTLGGTGIVAGAVIVNSGGRIAPENNFPGLQFGSVDLKAGSTLTIKTRDSYDFDQLDVVGTVNISNSVLDLQLGAVPYDRSTLTIVENYGVNPVNGTFANLPEGSVITSQYQGVDYEFTVSYVGSFSSNQITLEYNASDVVWDGGSLVNSSWTTAENWENDTAPIPGDNLIFPAGAARLSNNNDFAPGTLFHTITLSNGGYSITGNAIDLDSDIINITGDSTLAMDIFLIFAFSHTFTIPDGELTLSGAFGGSIGFSKFGNGTLIVSGNNNAGSISVYEGTVLLENVGGSGAASSVWINGGTLGGNGGASGSITVGAGGGTLAPGSSPGCLNAGDHLVLSNGITFEVELGGLTPCSEHDQLIVSNTATLYDTLDLKYTNGFTATPGNIFTILVAGVVSGTFDTVTFPDAQDWYITYCSNEVVVGVYPGPAAGLPADVWLYYPWDNNFFDYSTNSNHGILFDDNADGDAIISCDVAVFGDGGFDMGDTDDKINFTTPFAPTNGEPWTISFFAFLDGGAATYGFSSNAGNSFLIRADGNRRVLMQIAGQPEITWTSAVNQNTRHHFTIVANGTGVDIDGVPGDDKIAVYVDGLLETRISDNVTTSFTTDITFDQFGDGPVWPFGTSGDADELWIIQSALNAYQVLDLFNNNTFDSSPPILRWASEEGAGTNTEEVISGVSNVARLVNGPVWTNGLAPGSSNAIHFNTTFPFDEYLEAGTLNTDGLYIANSTNVDGRILSNQWTITGWVDIQSSSFADRCIITSDTTGGQNWWLFFMRNNSGLTNRLGFDFTSSRIESDIDVPAGKPVFVSITADNSGTAFSGSNRSRFAIWDGTEWVFDEKLNFINIRLDGLEIGSFNDGTRNFVGDLDEIRIYDTALTEAELVALALANEIDGDLGGAVGVVSNSITNIQFRIQFTEDVLFFNANDLLITGTLSNTPPIVTGGGSIYTASIPVVGEGTITVDLIPGAGVQTLDGAPLVYHTPAVTQLDFTPPFVVSIQASVTNSRIIEIVFSEPIIGLDSPDMDIFSITNVEFVNTFSYFSIDSTTYQGSVYADVTDGQTSGIYGIYVKTGSVTDIGGNALTTPIPTAVVEVAAYFYQLWAMDKGLTAKENFDYYDDPDTNGQINGHEFLHDGDPLNALDTLKRAIHIATVNGTNYFVLSIALPDSVAYSGSGSSELEVNYDDYIDMVEYVWVSSNIQEIVDGNGELMVDPAVTPPTGLPVLSSGFSYRHLRFTTPVEDLPIGFFMTDTYNDD